MVRWRPHARSSRGTGRHTIHICTRLSLFPLSDFEIEICIVVYMCSLSCFVYSHAGCQGTSQPEMLDHLRRWHRPWMDRVTQLCAGRQSTVDITIWRAHWVWTKCQLHLWVSYAQICISRNRRVPLKEREEGERSANILIVGFVYQLINQACFKHVERLYWLQSPARAWYIFPILTLCCKTCSNLSSLSSLAPLHGRRNQQQQQQRHHHRRRQHCQVVSKQRRGLSKTSKNKIKPFLWRELMTSLIRNTVIIIISIFKDTLTTLVDCFDMTITSTTVKAPLISFYFKASLCSGCSNRGSRDTCDRALSHSMR